MEASNFAYAEASYNDRGRVVAQGAQGADWQLGSGHEVKTAIQYNEGTEQIIRWDADGTSDSYYLANQLIMNTTTDENQHQVITYQDRKGNQILKKVEVAANQWLNTYYVYDHLDRRVYTIPPGAVELLGSGATHTVHASTLSELIFSYTYDEEGKMVTRKIPAKGLEYLVYDRLDRLVLTQDANLRAQGKWLFTKYDRAHRPVMTGLLSSSDSFNELTNYLGSMPDAAYESFDPDMAHQYTNNAFPILDSSAEVLTVTYYDDYAFLDTSESSLQFQNPDESYQVQMDGTSQYIALDQYYDQANSLNALTIEAWINTDFSGGNWADNWAIIDFDRSEHYSMFVHGSDGKVGFSTKGGNINDFYSNTAVNDGMWHHVAAVFDGTQKYIFIDGVLDNTHENPHNGALLGSSTTRFGIIGDGSEATTFNGTRNKRYFQGEIGEVRLWHTVRSAQQIHEYARVPLTGNETGLVGKWSMKDGPSVADETGNGNTGTAYNGATRNATLKEGGQAIDTRLLPHGSVTGHLVKTGSDWLHTVSYYDEQGMPVQTIANNHLGGIDRTTLYTDDYTNEVTRIVQQHDDGQNLIQTTQKIAYDHRGRVTGITHQVNGKQEYTLATYA